MFVEEGLIMDSPMCVPNSYKYEQACLPVMGMFIENNFSIILSSDIALSHY